MKTTWKFRMHISSVEQLKGHIANAKYHQRMTVQSKRHNEIWLVMISRWLRAVTFVCGKHIGLAVVRSSFNWCVDRVTICWLFFLSFTRSFLQTWTVWVDLLLALLKRLTSSYMLTARSLAVFCACFTIFCLIFLLIFGWANKRALFSIMVVCKSIISVRFDYCFIFCFTHARQYSLTIVT